VRPNRGRIALIDRIAAAGKCRTLFADLQTDFRHVSDSRDSGRWYGSGPDQSGRMNSLSWHFSVWLSVKKFYVKQAVKGKSFGSHRFSSHVILKGGSIEAYLERNLVIDNCLEKEKLRTR
jgi:hypothetical protein